MVENKEMKSHYIYLVKGQGIVMIHTSKNMKVHIKKATKEIDIMKKCIDLICEICIGYQLPCIKILAVPDCTEPSAKTDDVYRFNKDSFEYFKKSADKVIKDLQQQIKNAQKR